MVKDTREGETTQLPIVKKALEAQIKDFRENCCREALEIGAGLLQVKELMNGTKDFNRWVQDHIPLRTAQNMMRIAQVFKDRHETVSRIDTTGLYRLSKTSITNEQREAVIEESRKRPLSSRDVALLLPPPTRTLKRGVGADVSLRHFVATLKDLRLDTDKLDALLRPFANLRVQDLIDRLKDSRSKGDDCDAD